MWTRPCESMRKTTWQPGSLTSSWPCASNASPPGESIEMDVASAPSTAVQPSIPLPTSGRMIAVRPDHSDCVAFTFANNQRSAVTNEEIADVLKRRGRGRSAVAVATQLAIPGKSRDPAIWVDIAHARVVLVGDEEAALCGKRNVQRPVQFRVRSECAVAAKATLSRSRDG